MIDHLSHSSIQTYLTCPKQWSARYLDGKYSPVGVALVKGSAVDRAAEYNWMQKRDTLEDIGIEDACDVAEGAFREKIDEAGGRAEIDWHGDSMPSALDSTMRLTTKHMRDHAPLYVPEATQVLVERELAGGTRFIGYIDALAEGKVIDVKTGSRRLPQQDADRDLQASAYAFGLDRPIEFEFLRVIDTGKSPTHSEIIRTTRSIRGVQWYEDLANKVDYAIRAEIFHARPGYACGWCVLKDTCVQAITS